MSLTTPVSVQKLQTALHAKVKESPSFRSYALYDKVHREDVLAFALEFAKPMADQSAHTTSQNPTSGPFRDAHDMR
jgi:hypothetical protein